MIPGKARNTSKEEKCGPRGSPGSASESRGSCRQHGCCEVRTATRQSVKLQRKKWIAVLKRCFVDPLKIILLLRFLAVAVLRKYHLWQSLLSQRQHRGQFRQAPTTFRQQSSVSTYIPNSLGYFLASTFGGRWIDRIMKREARKVGPIDEKGNLICVQKGYVLGCSSMNRRRFCSREC